MAVFILEDALCVRMNLSKHLLFVWLFFFSVKTGTRRIIRPDELSSVERRSSRTTEDSSSRQIMRLVPVFTLETNNQTNNECLPKFLQTHNASSSVKTASFFFLQILCQSGCENLIDNYARLQSSQSSKLNTSTVAWVVVGLMCDYT